jgi:shikimate dehydrogenase
MNSATKKVGLIGYPISHSLSPGMQNATFAALGLDYHYTLLPTRPDELETTLANFAANNFVGGNVTMPHKQTIMAYLDELSDDARIIGAVNTIHLQDGRLIGYNTDCIGFINALIEAGHQLTSRRVLLYGAGGAARAAMFGLAQAGVEEIIIINRTESRGIQLKDEMTRAFPACNILFKPLEVESITAASKDADLIVNTTSVGMEPQEGLSIWPNVVPIPAKAVFYDVIYKPAQTIFLQRAQSAGQPTLNGMGMIIHQGIAGFKIWTGYQPPLETMRQAFLNALNDAKNHH